MLAKIALLGLSLALSATVRAQSELLPTEWGLAATGAYAATVYVDRNVDLSRFRGPGASVDATFQRFSVGGAVVVFPESSTTRVGGAFHVVRNLDRQVVTSVGLAFQASDRSDDLLSPSITHSRRISGRPDAALIASVAVGGALPSHSGSQIEPAVTAVAGLTWMTDRGPVRTLISPSVGGTLSQVSSLSVGLALGLALGGG